MLTKTSQREEYILVRYYDRYSQCYRPFRTRVVKHDRFSDRVLAKGRNGCFAWFIPDSQYPRFHIAEMDSRLLSHG